MEGGIGKRHVGYAMVQGSGFFVATGVRDHLSRQCKCARNGDSNNNHNVCSSGGVSSRS